MPLLTWLGLVDCSIRPTSGPSGWCARQAYRRTISWGPSNRVWTAFLWAGDTWVSAITCMVITQQTSGSVF